MSSRKMVLSACAVLLAGCTGTENPQLAMCKSVTERLIGSSPEWTSSDVQEKSELEMVVKVGYKTSGGNSGSVNCNYRKPSHERDNPNALYPTSPNKVVLNGQAIDQQRLMQAAGKASTEILEGVAQETAKQAKALAEETGVRAEQLTEQAEKLVREAEQSAGAIAEQIGDRVKDATIDASQAVQEALRNK